MWSRTRKASAKKTKSVRKYTQTLLKIAAITLVVGAIFVIGSHHDNGVRFGTRTLQLERVDTEAARIRGLSGRQGLPEGQGMLFVFDGPGHHCMWMKDMNFAIDIVWLDGHKNVVHVEERVTPETYPESFCPPVQAKYVIEVSDGFVQESGLATGQHVDF